MAANSAVASSFTSRPGKPVMSLSMRIALMVALVIVFTVSLVSFLNYSNYRKNHHELSQSRYLVLANDIRRAIEQSLNLGLPLGQLTQAQQLLDDVLRREKQVAYIHVYNDQGGIAFSTDATQAGKAGGQPWVDRLSSIKPDAYWQGAAASEYLVAVPVVNNFNAKVGLVLIAYARQPIDLQTAAMRDHLVMDTLGVAVLSLLILVVGIRLVMRTVEPDIAQVELALDRFLADPQATQDDAKVSNQDLRRGLAEFEQAGREALSAIDEAASGREAKTA